MSTLHEGQKIGDYTVQSLIKKNLYTETYRVEDEKQQVFFLKLFVMKRLPQKMVNNVSGAVLEIEYCKQLKHKNLVSFIADGKVQLEEGECQYYLTNYFSGEVLADKIRRNGKLPIEKALTIFRGMLDSLSYMHQQGLCHNDITPQNIMLSATMGEVPEIIDLGHTAPPCNGKVPFDTSDLEIFYAANETFAGVYDEQSDIFSATAVLYTMLTAKEPWEMCFSESMNRSRRAVLMKDKRKSTPLEVDSYEWDERLKAILLKGLAVKYEKRYKDVEAVINDLEGNTVSVQDDLQADKKNKNSRQQDSSEKKTQPTSPNLVDFEIRRGSGNGFKDIAGMEELKNYLSQRIIFVIKNKEQVEKYRLTPPNGMLLYGPPGCGKTFVAEKFAEETGFNFILIKSSDLSSSYHHGSQEKIAQLFEQAEKQAPIVICFDEFDALVPDRSIAANAMSAGEVNEFLSQLNNCAQRGIFVVGTTNRPDKIDPAVLRRGRIDKQVYIPMPDKEARREMFHIHLQGRPFEEEQIDWDRLSELSEGFIASDIAYVVNDAAMIAAYTNQPITEDLLVTTLKNTRPSLRKEILELFENIRRKMEGIERNNLNVRPKIGFIK